MARISVAELDIEHREIFSRAISSVLNTNLAEFTYAQILDGLPTAEVFRNRYNGPLHIHHPLRRHIELCPGVLERVKKHRDEFNPLDLSFDSKVGIQPKDVDKSG